MLKAIIYDFDGVICNSVNIKTEAFADMYKSYGNKVVHNVIAYHQANGGISRFEKFKYYHKILLGQEKELTEAELTDLGNQFSSIALKRVINANYIPGAEVFLSQMSNKYQQFICTGTPDDEIRIILQQRKLMKYFTNIYGSPCTKTTILQKIKKKYKLESSEMLFFGDAMTDYYAAKAENVRFIGVASINTNFPDGITIINNFNDSKLQSIL